MPSNPPSLHPFDEATRIAASDSGWTGKTSPAYWAFVGPFGGFTAATLLRALNDHPQRSGDPLSLTVNYCAPISEGPFDLDVRLIKANRSTQHWSIELTQGAGDVAAFATAVFAVRRPSWDHAPSQAPAASSFEATRPYPKSAMAVPWTQSYDFRFIEGAPDLALGPAASPRNAYSKLWIADRPQRTIDAMSLMAMSDAFFARIFHVRNEFVPFGTVSLTTYFHIDMAELATLALTHVLAVADASVFHKSYADQTGTLWSPLGQLLATTHQIAYFKA